MNKENIILNKKYYHKNLGPCIFTEQCSYMEKFNCDNSSIFMYINLESNIKEVSLHLIEELDDCGQEQLIRNIVNLGNI
jgi:hypothetical protein